MSKQDFLVVTGQSGAGLSSTLKCLEDLGYEVLDNFPLDLVPALLERREANGKPIALGIDARSTLFSLERLVGVLELLNAKHTAKLVFVTCQDEKLQQRFSETRRPHPLGKDRPVMDGIHAEHILLDPVRQICDTVIDTTELSIHDLRRFIDGMFGVDARQRLCVNFLSFSYKKGLPREADLVFDVRFLKNPHWDDALRPLTGKNLDVQAHIKEDPLFSSFQEKLQEMLTLLIPAYEREGKRYLTIAFGCTGGKHRSVFCAEAFDQWFKACDLAQSQVQHREIG
ncbi:MAG: RNase adapter RapZ [Bdellovibrionales bacterium]